MSVLIVRVIARTPSPVVRRCARCDGPREFVSSGRFRVNAQKKRLDVWLVFKCAACDATWNATVHERARAAELPDLDGYHANDAALAARWAMALGGAGSFDLELEGERSAARLRFRVPSPLRVRADLALARALGLSRAAAARLVRGFVQDGLEVELDDEARRLVAALPIAADPEGPSVADLRAPELVNPG